MLGGISPIDPAFLRNMADQGVLEHVDVVARARLPARLEPLAPSTSGRTSSREIQAVTSLPVWVTEVGVSTFGAEEVQEFGLRRTAELLLRPGRRASTGTASTICPARWPATTRHREAEGSSYYRHFYMGLLREDGTPKPAAAQFAEYAPAMGICQWFHFEDHRLDDAVALAPEARRAPPPDRTELGRQPAAPAPRPGSTGRCARSSRST